uniref:Extrinsic protein in photosystem II n=2 Tax=Chaetoceros debilis TaxID=122233 RepID=A0A7S3PWK0_9STRA|eukprot:CAMPEP_0194095400 /NCGR_PEP_ID=MMETSP0149-20130528/56808_1 /TAXON_ID=122233 /ORGANISM="Chaetoceros debilis, Strain MM31A-1" /LENGTH=215 /DNA_ID=CAMNT_0038781343 /DNA_START=526 /DNA_END=1173 /DNA_ORIENTATION=-
MKSAICLTLVASAAAFAPEASNARVSTAVNAEARREVFGKIVAAGAAFLPAAANAAVGESPRFSVFGLIGDGTSYSEGGAYGSDQTKPTYSPYSVYEKAGKDSLYNKEGGGAMGDGYVARKKAILAETKNRLNNNFAYVEKKQWFNVKDELTRYMYETRGAVRGLAVSNTQKEMADDFFKAIETVYGKATTHDGAACANANAAAIKALDAFIATL